MGSNKIGFDNVYDRLYAHVNNFWKSEKIDKFKWELGKIENELPKFSVIQVSPTESKSPWVYLTHGAWEVDSGEDYRLEFFIISPIESSIHIETLTMLTSFYFKSKDYNLGRCINIGRGWLDDSSLNHLLISLPYAYGPELENCRVGNHLKVRYLWLMPISSEERIYLEKYGLEELERKFDILGINYLDPSRKSVV